MSEGEILDVTDIISDPSTPGNTSEDNSDNETESKQDIIKRIIEGIKHNRETMNKIIDKVEGENGKGIESMERISEECKGEPNDNYFTKVYDKVLELRKKQQFFGMYGVLHDVEKYCLDKELTRRVITDFINDTYTEVTFFGDTYRINMIECVSKIYGKDLVYYPELGTVSDSLHTINYFKDFEFWISSDRYHSIISTLYYQLNEITHLENWMSIIRIFGLIRLYIIGLESQLLKDDKFKTCLIFHLIEYFDNRINKWITDNGGWYRIIKITDERFRGIHSIYNKKTIRRIIEDNPIQYFMIMVFFGYCGGNLLKTIISFFRK